MKTIKNTVKGLLAGALTVLALTSSANDNFFKLEVVEDRVFKLEVENVNGNASIKIEDQKGVQLLSKPMKATSKLTTKFDLSSLPQGTYKLTYADDFKVQIASIIIEDELSFDMEGVQFVPVIVEKSSKLKVGLLSQARTKMVISVYDDSNQLLVSEVLQGEDYFGKQYDFSKVRKGTYRVVVSASGRTYSKTIKI